MRAWIRSSLIPSLTRLDVQIHREVLRLRASYQLSLDEFRGLYVSDKHVDALIQQMDNANGFSDMEEVDRKLEQAREVSLKSLEQDALWNKLSRCYDLTKLEQDVLIVVLAPELESKYELLYAYLNNDVTRKYPTLDLAMRFASDEEREVCRTVLSARSKLCRMGLIENREGVQSIYELQSGYQLSPIVRDHLLAGNTSIDSLQGLLRPVEHEFVDWPLLPIKSDVTTRFREYATRLRFPQHTEKLELVTSRHSGAEFLVANAVKESGFSLCTLNLNQLASDKSELVRQLQQVALLCRLGDIALMVNLHAVKGISGDDGKLLPLVLQWLANANLNIVYCCEETSEWRELLASQHCLSIALPESGLKERHKQWRYLLCDRKLKVEEQVVNRVAEFFTLDFKQIAHAVDWVKLQTTSGDQQAMPIDGEILFKAAAAQSHSEISNLADKLNNKFSFSHLILPDEINSRLREFVMAIQHRKLVFEDWGLSERVGGAKGLVAMFSGSSGTGKTMAASVIANEIGLDMYRVDLSRVVSKYIGETEKNLDKIFNAARQANCILFFDEADALFGKRSEVKDAHDRYANVEIAYLLQKMESHDGVAILTTNLSRNIDSAFSRRLQYIIEFPRPDDLLRERIWLSMFSSKVPLDDNVDFEFLARQFKNTGGDIKNIVLDAALLAANSERQVIDMTLLVKAAARHMVKQGKVPSASEFKHYFGLLRSTG